MGTILDKRGSTTRKEHRNQRDKGGNPKKDVGRGGKDAIDGERRGPILTGIGKDLAGRGLPGGGH